MDLMNDDELRGVIGGSGSLLMSSHPPSAQRSANMQKRLDSGK
jgi:Zn-dependent protease with chaperone function